MTAAPSKQSFTSQIYEKMSKIFSFDVEIVGLWGKVFKAKHAGANHIAKIVFFAKKIIAFFL